MKLRTQILALGLAGATLAGLTGGAGLLAARHLGETTGEAVAAGRALQASQEADMMHDAIRGDAQLAMLGALTQDAAKVAEAAQELQDHAATFDEALRRLGTMPLEARSRTLLEAVRPLQARYVQAATEVVQSARTEGAAVARGQAAGHLQQAFSALEDQMAALSASVEESAVTRTGRAQTTVGRSALIIAVTLLAATLAIVGVSVVLARRLTAPMRHAVEAAERLVQGDLTTVIVPQGCDEAARLLQAMSRMRDSLASIVSQVKANADNVAVASAEIAQGNADLSSRTELQAGAVQQTASTMDELGATMRRNADSARQASELTRSASQAVSHGGTLMAQMSETMSGIDDSARRIAGIIGVIDGIAFQTNILALNAAVEAARAGEQGRGFAVVAGEVRTLAQRSAQAAREVRALVDASVQRAAQGSTLAADTGQAMNGIVEAIGRVSTIVDDISAASAQQSTGVLQVGQAVAHIDQTAQQNAALVEQSAAAADTLRQQAGRLVQAVAAFKLSPGDLAEAAAAA